MTNPPGPPHGDPSPWARGAGQPGHDTSEPPTQQIGVPNQPGQPPTAAIPHPPPGQDQPSATASGTPQSTETTKTKKSTLKRLFKRLPVNFLRDPLSIFLVVITVVALAVAGLIGAALYGRHVADEKVAETTECEVQDAVTVSFGASPPLLWQRATERYTNISIQTAGNRLKDALEMKADLRINDVRLHRGGDSRGTIGALDAVVTWPAEGIKKTIRGMIPLFGNLVQDVTTHSDDGTVELKGLFGLGGIVVKPIVQNEALSLEVVKVSGLAGLAGGVTKENAQAALNTFGQELTSKYPLGIHPDSIDVTDDGVMAKFSTRNAPIPSHSQNPCFANL